MTIAGRMWNLLRDPDVFFTRLESEPADFALPVFIVILPGLGFIAAFIFEMTLAGPAGGRSENEIIMTLFTSSPLIMTFFLGLLAWVVVSVVIWLVSRTMSGTGSLARTLQVTGYGTLPSGIYSFVSQVLAMGVIRAMTTSPYTGMMVIPMLIISLSFAFTFWTWYLWLIGTARVHRLTKGNAFIAVAVAIITNIIAGVCITTGIMLAMNGMLPVL